MPGERHNRGMYRRHLLAAGLAGPLLPAAAQARVAKGPLTPDASIRLWPGEAPGLLDPTLDDQVENRSKDPAVIDRAMHRIRTPRMDVFRAAKPNGAAVLVMPGGGYGRVVFDKEGYELGAWLSARGVTVFVLMYRLPGEGWRDRSNAPLADAQRAMRLIRARAAEWKLDQKRVGAMGFSAGGHLCADLATRFARKVYEPVDAADALDARPMLAAPIYPVVSMDPAITHAGSRNALLGPDPTPELEAEHSPDRQVTAATPPCFLAHAEDDLTVPVENSLRLRAALRAAKVPVEMHLFETGGHGFGMRPSAGRTAQIWPDLFLSWAKAHDFLG
ncbi:alpha/beta hydrolase [Sphingomonas sp.]|jgi:acetyl esterase/lipase|uniref:alpha/beta hydrolase n=1 Tax=Sphingomonas sp. TaxID=28214 RepID=UPI002ED95877